MRLAGLITALTLAAAPQDPKIREGYVIPAEAKRIDLKEPAREPGAARLAVVPVEWTDLHHPDGWNLDTLNLQFLLRSQYVQRNRLNQQPSGSLADWLQQNSFDAFKFGGRAFNWVELPWAWEDVKGARAAGPTTQEVVSRAMDAVTKRDGANAFADTTHLMLLTMGSRRELHPENPLYPGLTRVNIGNRVVRVGIIDAGPITFRQNGEQATGIAPIARMFMRMLDAPVHPVSTGPWCLMSEAWDGDNADVRAFGGEHRPFHVCAPCKTHLGWIKPVAVDPAVEQRIALRPVENWPDALRIPIVKDGSDSWIVENRQRRGFDRNLPGFGLLFWHVRNGTATLVPAHGVDAPDALWKFDLAVPFPTLHTTAFSPESVPSSRRGVAGELRVVVGGMSIEADGTAYLTVGTKASVSERVTYEGATYTIVPRMPGMTAASISVAVVCAEWPDAGHGSSIETIEDYYLRRGRFAWVKDNRGLDVRRPTWSFADVFSQITGGALALEPVVLGWEREGRAESWVTLPKPQAAYARTPAPQLLGEILDEVVQKGDRAATAIEKADVVVVVMAGKGRPGTGMAPGVTAVPRGRRVLPVATVLEDGATDPSLPMAAVMRSVKLHEKVSNRAASNDGSKGWCFAGGAAPSQGRYGPCVLCTACRTQLGWLEPYEAAEGAYVLAPLVLASSALKLPIGEGEYYLFENRTQWELDRGVPREGLVIWHVTPKEKPCRDCWENGVLDVWLAHEAPPRGTPADLPGRYAPFLSLPKKGLSLRLPKGGWEIRGITCDPRGNLYFEASTGR